MSAPAHPTDTTTGTVPVPVDAKLPAVMAAPSPAPQTRRRWVIALLGAVLTAGVALLFYWQPWTTGPAPVVVEVAALAPVTRVLAVNGRIAALHTVDVRALASGPLVVLHVAEGDVVAAGTVLAEVDPTTQRAVLRQATAGLVEARVAQDQAQADYDRSLALGANIARMTLDAAATAVQTAAQEVARLTALADQAQIGLTDFTVRAPMAGTVLALHVAAGERVDPATLLLTIADLSVLIVRTDVDEAHATQVRPGQPAVLRLTGEAADRPGRVTVVSQQVDAATGGLGVEIGFDAGVTAPVGLTVTANIVVDRRDAALTIPRTALAPDGDGTAVFVVTDGKAVRRVLSVIDWPATRLVVTDGLSVGEGVIVDATGISDGQAVTTSAP